MKVSIRVKITIMVITFALFIITASWFLCQFVFERAFVMNVKTNLKKTYDSCNVYFKEIQYKEESTSIMGGIENPLASMIVIIDIEKSKVYSTINDESQMMDRMKGIIETIENTGGSFLERGHYQIRKNHDEILNADFYDLIGVLDNGMTIVIRSPLSRVNFVVGVITKVFNKVVIGLLIISSVFILALSNVFSSPIKRISNAAKKMTELDFDVKVPVVTNDEIGELATYMNKMSDTLEKNISELKAANIRLKKDIDDKQQIDDMRKEFLSHVSHELKTPIALIQGYAEGLKDMADDEESREFYTDVIIDEATKMNTLVKKLLDLNEIEFGNDPIRIERFELVEFVSQIIASSQILIDDAKADVVFEEKAPVYVWADEFMIEEVFTNLLTNAIHYVVPNGIIKISFQKIDGDIRVLVYNQGERISDEDIDKLFIKFYKADKARTREYGGSGIGLSIVAASMQAHGKKYGVYNVEDGVVFYFDLDANIPC